MTDIGSQPLSHGCVVLFSGNIAGNHPSFHYYGMFGEFKLATIFHYYTPDGHCILVRSGINFQLVIVTQFAGDS